MESIFSPPLLRSGYNPETGCMNGPNVNRIKLCGLVVDYVKDDLKKKKKKSLRYNKQIRYTEVTLLPKLSLLGQGQILTLLLG